MPSKVVSTKLSIEEHGKFLELCKIQNCTPSTLIKSLILNLIANLENNENSSLQQSAKTVPLYQKKQTSFIANDNQISLPANEIKIKEILQKIDDNEINVEGLNQLYLKLGEKFEKNGLSKSEEDLYRKTHQKLKEKLQYNSIAQIEIQSKHTEEKKSDDRNMSVEERFQYF